MTRLDEIRARWQLLLPSIALIDDLDDDARTGRRLCPIATTIADVRGLHALMAEVERLQARLHTCGEALNLHEIGHATALREVERLQGEVAAERAATVAWLRSEGDWDAFDEARYVTPRGFADAIERGEHRRTP